MGAMSPYQNPHLEAGLNLLIEDGPMTLDEFATALGCPRMEAEDVAGELARAGLVHLGERLFATRAASEFARIQLGMAPVMEPVDRTPVEKL
jgi:hypothetical protein